MKTGASCVALGCGLFTATIIALAQTTSPTFLAQARLRHPRPAFWRHRRPRRSRSRRQAFWRRRPQRSFRSLRQAFWRQSTGTASPRCVQLRRRRMTTISGLNPPRCAATSSIIGQLPAVTRVHRVQFWPKT